ncbi:hypothetical protein BJ742DRAFT_746011 [Cladochytrium replicatum]|nr:hypothetical protein BJ742DRAFT_746011 [Cladochytrium replicatum]
MSIITALIMLLSSVALGAPVVNGTEQTFLAFERIDKLVGLSGINMTSECYKAFGHSWIMTNETDNEVAFLLYVEGLASLYKSVDPICDNTCSIMWTYAKIGMDSSGIVDIRCYTYEGKKSSVLVEPDLSTISSARRTEYMTKPPVYRRKLSKRSTCVIDGAIYTSATSDYHNGYWGDYFRHLDTPNVFWSLWTAKWSRGVGTVQTSATVVSNCEEYAEIVISLSATDYYGWDNYAAALLCLWRDDWLIATSSGNRDISSWMYDLLQELALPTLNIGSDVVQYKQQSITIRNTLQHLSQEPHKCSPIQGLSKLSTKQLGSSYNRYLTRKDIVKQVYAISAKF